MVTKNITITGAAGNIAYSLIFRILSNSPFKDTDKINIRLLDISQSQKSLMGLKYEIEDCAFESLENLLITDDAELAFTDADYILMVGAKPRSKGMERSDLILDNAEIFRSQAQIVNDVCSKNTKIVIVGNPANTNALIMNYNTPKIPNENITSLMKLDQNRAKSILATKLDERVENIKNMVIWGNHSTTQVPDLYNCVIPSKEISLEHSWIHDTFIPRVQKRGGEIIEFRGLSSAASAASAIYDHIYVLEFGSDDCEALGVLSTGEYNISPDLMFSFPLTINDGTYTVIDNIDINDSLIALIKQTEEELLKERDIVKKYLL
tara:strand:- start:40 stop:1005 length:966 start_codon:yes stop_codon:yes gene_type:complete